MKQLMLKSLMLMLLSSGAVFAKGSDDGVKKDIVDFVKRAISVNPKFKLKDVRISKSKPVEQIKGWNVYFLDIDLEMKDKKHTKTTVHDKIFANGEYLARDFIALANKSSLKDKIVPDISDNSFYKKERLLYGNANAPHKIVAFSDPLCPFCQDYMPKLIKAVKEHPDKIALYYYHFPLQMLHKASPTVIKAILVAEKQGMKDVVEKVYAKKFEMDTSDEDKILNEFNKAMGTKISKKDINTQDILVHYSSDIESGGKLMISGTPTIYVDGKKDFSRQKYKEFIK
ncbi:MAG: disulfide bond formation protein DsbA [Sulfurospirillum sp.]|nr:MAG: disulfide bond formation protein DsbA [Sulfurospirillum sp.]